MSESLPGRQGRAMEAVLITLAEAAVIMGIPSEAKGKRVQNRLWELLPRLMGQGFPVRRVGRRWMVHKPLLLRWMEEHWRRAA